MFRTGILFALLLAPLVASAEVADSSPGGFTLKINLSVAASPADVYRAFVHSIGDWWDPGHTFSGNSHNLSIEDKASGCFCEKLPDGGGVRHMEVVYVSPGKQIVLNGGLGPLQSLATTGSMTVKFSPGEGGTKLEAAYAVGGYMPGGLNTLAPVVDGVLLVQLTRLKNYAEHREPGQAK
jgi:uncharacterized protein YndB with AHSA1/START domain